MFNKKKLIYLTNIRQTQEVGRATQSILLSFGSEWH